MSGSKLSDASAVPSANAPSSTPFAGDQPLGLTIHALPDPSAAAPAVRTRVGRWKMLAVLLVCAAPVIASYFTYYVVRPEARSSFGELIEPQRPLPDAAATMLDGRALPLRELKGQWLLVAVAPAACDSACEKHLYLQRQMRETLGKEKDRVEWIWLVDDAAPVNPALLPALKQATVLRVNRAVLDGWLQPAAHQALRDHLYVVDPMGNWMMRFPAGLDATNAGKAKRDLDRLLRASSSWDEAGR